MNRALILLVFAEAFYGLKCWVLEDDSKSDYSNVKNFQWTTDASALERFSHLEKLHFINAKIDTVTQNFENQLENCIWLKFSGGKVKTAYINSKIAMFSLEDTSTEKVIIVPELEYNLGTLIIKNTKLSKLPQNINQLKKINRIDIMDNWIESVSMNEFQGLDKLYEINLSGNRIRLVDSNGFISLPKLFRLKLQNNFLQQLDTCNWDMPQLYELWLHNNSLSHFAIGHLTNVRDLTLASNPLNCAWINSLVSHLPSLLSDEYTCDESNQDEFSLHCQKRQQHLNENPDSNSRLHKLESAVQNLEEKLAEQGSVVGIMVESILRSRLENMLGLTNDPE